MRKISLTSRARLLFVLSVLALGMTPALSGCNVFSFIDKPSGDEQILSAARACFDQADYACAREYYAQLSGSYADIRASEEAFLILAENGATMADFMETFGSGGGGEALTALAERMAPGSVAKRLKVQNAFRKYDEITGNPSLKALVRFVGSVALAAEFLAEEIPSAGGQLTKERIASGGGSCSSGTCASDENCGAPTVPAPIIADGIFGNGFDFLTTDLPESIDLGHFKSAMTEMSNALSDLSASGGFGDGAGGMSDSIENETLNGTPSAYQCFRSNMLSLGIGR